MSAILHWLASHWAILVLAYLALVLLSVLGSAAIPWLKKASLHPLVRVGLEVFVLIPIVLLVIGAVYLLKEEYQVLAVRGLFLLVVVLLPATMYYLFIATSKASLLNEFISNLNRLGLPTSNGRHLQSDPIRDRRLRSYLQKFEAMYGPLTDAEWQEVCGTSRPPAGAGQPLSAKLGGSSEATVPVFIATVLIALGWLLALPPWQIPPAANAALPGTILTAALTPKEIPVYFAFLGAYFFIVQMLFRRYVQQDLLGSAYVGASLRIILAVIGTWVVLAAMAVTFPNASAASLLVVSFVIGFFPPLVWQFASAAVKKVTGYVLPTLQSQMPVTDLDGLTIWHQARLEEEGIENIPNMATADLVELMLRTTFPSNRIVDWVDQAILYTQLGPEQAKDASSSPRQVLRAHGIRTASALLKAYEASGKPEDRDQFERILASAGTGRRPIRSLVDTIITSPNLPLIQAWQASARSAESIALTVPAQAGAPAAADTFPKVRLFVRGL